MKKVIAFILSIAAMQASIAEPMQNYNPKTYSPMVSYNDSRFFVPNENNLEELPEVIPCVKVTIYRYVRCHWFANSRQISVPSQVPGEYAVVDNEQRVLCRRNTCRSQFFEMGHWPEDVDLLVSFWYVVQPSTDGKMIAVRRDLQLQASYGYAGLSLFNWYLQLGMSDDVAKNMMEHHYSGGWDQFLIDYEKTCEELNYESSYCGG